MEKKKKRGFAAMKPEEQREIASLGGKAVSENREYMSMIGKLGGHRSAEVRNNAKKKKQNVPTSKSD